MREPIPHNFNRLRTHCGRRLHLSKATEKMGRREIRNNRSHTTGPNAGCHPSTHIEYVCRQPRNTKGSMKQLRGEENSECGTSPNGALDDQAFVIFIRSAVVPETASGKPRRPRSHVRIVLGRQRNQRTRGVRASGQGPGFRPGPCVGKLNREAWPRSRRHGGHWRESGLRAWGRVSASLRGFSATGAQISRVFAPPGEKGGPGRVLGRNPWTERRLCALTASSRRNRR